MTGACSCASRTSTATSSTSPMTDGWSHWARPRTDPHHPQPLHARRGVDHLRAVDLPVPRRREVGDDQLARLVEEERGIVLLAAADQGVGLLAQHGVDLVEEPGGLPRLLDRLQPLPGAGGVAQAVLC